MARDRLPRRLEQDELLLLLALRDHGGQDASSLAAHAGRGGMGATYGYDRAHYRLTQMRKSRWVTAYPEVENGVRRNTWRLTKTGREALVRHLAAWT